MTIGTYEDLVGVAICLVVVAIFYWWRRFES